jgi:hypothetical protein
VGLREVLAELDVKVRGAGAVTAANRELDRYVQSLAPADAAIEDLRVKQAEAADMASRLGQRLRGLQSAEGADAAEVEQLRRAQFRAQDAAKAYGQEISALEQKEREAAAAARKLQEDTAALPGAIAPVAEATGKASDQAKTWQERLRAWATPANLAVAGLAAIAAAATAVASAVRAAVEMLGELIDEGHELANLAARLNVSTTELQRWRFIAEQTGLETTALTSSFGALARNVEAASHGGGPAVRDFRRLHVALRDGNGELRDQGELFADTVRALAGVEDRTRRAAIAQRIFSEGGTQLLALIDEGPEAIDRLSGRFDELGGGLSEDVVAGAEEAHDSMAEFDVILTSLRSRLAQYILPTLNRFLTWASDFVTNASAVVGRSSALWIVWRALEPVAAILLNQLTMLGLMIWAVVRPALQAFLVFEDLVTAFRGGRSEIGALVEQWLRAHGVALTFGGAVDQVGLAFTRFEASVARALATVASMASVLPGLAPLLGPLAASLGDVATRAEDELATDERIATATEAGRLFSRKVAGDPTIAERAREAASSVSVTHAPTYNITSHDPEGVRREIEAYDRRSNRAAADALPLAPAPAGG